MICPFCQQSNPPEHEFDVGYGMYQCFICSTEKLTIEYSSPGEWYWSAVSSDLYTIEICYYENKTKFYAAGDEETGCLLLTVPRLLDIRPETFDQWIEWSTRWKTLS